ncbi:hypothetical protein GCM10011344_38480 [Dokdonia pacifica]|uniref:DUF4230 domain-containing protein n=1 Tax=Dokdonia pacifica TaxID=1627892 RepID=A0A238ZYJ1_9FLAO|nr:DUF4230 domain-containing protein [Dokdonia pacifica]GGG34006.1 hypothetical protein GCM10011344_38480 [Dokdonia pacifica]SNR88329.1 Protein of unknown function [Dokdonia pacifica]
MEFLFLGLALGAIVAYFLYGRFAKRGNKAKVHSQSMVLMERIRSVCKFITVEGDFAEIYHYESLREKWIQKLLGTKKALVLIDAKAHIGFDLTKVRMEADEETKTIRLYDFPSPELLSIETDFKFYDKKEGWANPLTSTDLTEINKEAKQHIVDKIPNSGLYKQASQQALDTIILIQKLVETIGWQLDYDALKITTPEEPPKLNP